MLQGFLDESGDTGKGSGSTNYLVVAIVMGDGKKLGKAEVLSNLFAQFVA